MPTTVLLSIKPAFADAIFNKTKTFEFRRTLFASPDVKKVLVYASSPIQRVIGEFTIAEILSMTPDALWGATRHGAGISEHYFRQYFNGKRVAYAIGVGRIRKFASPRGLAEHYGVRSAPQSFCYVEASRAYARAG